MKLPRRVGKTVWTTFLLMIACPAVQMRADVTVSQTGKLTGVVAEEYTKKIRVKGFKMRVDSLYGKESRVLIYNLETGKKFRLDAVRKVAFVSDLVPFSRQADGRAITAKIARSISPTGKQSEVIGKSCTEYTFELRIPHALSSGGSTLERDSGTVCVSQSIAEGLELTNFVHEAKRRDYAQAAVSLTPTNTTVDGIYFYGDEPNVVVLFAKTQTILEHGLTAALNPMPRLENTMKVTEINSDAIPDEMFQIPAGWKIKNSPD
jgi:hypothetical protein